MTGIEKKNFECSMMIKTDQGTLTVIISGGRHKTKIRINRKNIKQIMIKKHKTLIIFLEG